MASLKKNVNSVILFILISITLTDILYELKHFEKTGKQGFLMHIAKRVTRPFELFTSKDTTHCSAHDLDYPPSSRADADSINAHTPASAFHFNEDHQ